MTGQAVALAAAAGPAEDGSRRLASLFDAHHQRLYRLARRLTGSVEDARDLVQDAFVRAARAPGAIPEGAAHEEAWLVRVMVNLARDRWRRRAVERRADPRRAMPPAAGSPEAGAVARATIWRALETIAPRRRAILVMYELEGLAIPAIAAMLGVAPVTVRWHLSRGRRELARRLGVSWRAS